jgi:Asp-tRNA(Asn)/Glu-tRNA(Gln) amidotransferase A subunit family amidase
MDAERVLALAYPTIRRKAAKIGDAYGAPGHQLPAGFTDDGLPAGLELMGRAFSESTLLRIAYAYERASACADRRPPATPRLQ